MKQSTMLTLEDLCKADSPYLDRKAFSLTDSKKREFPKANRGFTWDKDDWGTKKWRPQGISGLTFTFKEKGKKKKTEQELLVVSWYGKGSYSKYGARISIIDINDLTNTPDSKPRYRHILLTDADGNTLHDKAIKEGDVTSSANNDPQVSVKASTMHAGGIVVINKKLHVADSRKAYRCIRVFDLDKIHKITGKTAMEEGYGNYRYILQEEYQYEVPITPSFMSYDRDKDKILIGKFNQSPSKDAPNLFTWINPVHTAGETIGAYTIHRLPNKYKKIQGIAAKKYGKTQKLYLSTSYGKGNRSNFYELTIDKLNKKPKSATIDFDPSTKYPPGLEDTYISTKSELWMLTEFYYKEGSYTSTQQMGNSSGGNLDIRDNTISKNGGTRHTRRVVFSKFV